MSAPTEWQANISKAFSNRSFVIGLTITLVLRFAPKGLLPEKVVRHE